MKIEDTPHDRVILSRTLSGSGSSAEKPVEAVTVVRATDAEINSA